MKLLKLWNSTFQELPDEIKQAKTQEELMALVDDMAAIIEQEEEIPELRETEFDLEEAFRSPHHVSIEIYVGDLQRLTIACALGMTIGGRYVYLLSADSQSNTDLMVATRGNVITDDGIRYMVMSVEPRYIDAELKYYVLTVEKMNA